MSNVLESLLGAIRGGVHPRETGLAASLGVLAGFVSGWNLTLAVVLLAVLVLRTPWKMFGQAWAVAAGVAWALTPVTFHAGHFLLTETPAGDWLAPHADGPWIALFDLDRYTLIGGAFLAAIVAVPIGWAVASTTRAVQERLVVLQEKMSANQHWQARLSTRLVCWLLFGGTEVATAAPPQVGWFRKAGVAAMVLVIVPAAASAWLYLPKTLERGVLHGMSLANQAEVTAQRCELRLSEGLLEIEGLQVADPRNLDRDRVRIDQLTADLRPGPLLRGQLLVEKLAVSGVACDVARDRPARPVKVGKLDFSGFGGDDKPEPRDEPAEHGDICGFGLPEYAKDWKQIDGRLRLVKGLLEQIEYLATKCKALSPERRKPEPIENADDLSGLTLAYAELRAMRHTFGPAKPAVWIEDLRATNFAPGWGFGENAKVQLTDLASEPELTRRPVKLLIEADRGEVKLAATFNVHHPGAPHDVAFEARGIALERLVDTSKLSNAFAIQTGKLQFAGQGTMTSRQVDLPMIVAIRDLNVRLLGEQKIAGLTPDLWNQGLSKLGGLDVQSRLTGRWNAPRLRVNTKDLGDQFQSQLLAAGHTVLAQAVQGQLARGQQAIAKAVDKATGTAQGAIAEQRAKVDTAIGAAQQEVAKATETVQKQGAAALQGIAATQNQARDGADKAAAEVQQQFDRAGGAAKDWIGNRSPLSNLGGGSRDGVAGGNPFAQAVGSALDAAAAQSRQHVETGRQSTAQIVDGGGTAARSPLSQMLEKAAVADQATQNSAAQARGQLDSTQLGTNNAISAGAGQTNYLTNQAAQGVRSSLPGGDSPQVTTNAPAAIGPYTEVRPGSSPFPNPFSMPPGGPGADPRGGGGVASAEDGSLPGAGGQYPAVPPTPGGAARPEYPPYPSTAPQNSNPSQYGSPPGGSPPAQQAGPSGPGAYDSRPPWNPSPSRPGESVLPGGSAENPFGTQTNPSPPFGGSNAGNTAAPNYPPYPNDPSQPQYPTTEPYPTTQPQYPTTQPQYPTTQPQNPAPAPQYSGRSPTYPTAPPSYSPPTEQYPAAPPYSGGQSPGPLPGRGAGEWPRGNTSYPPAGNPGANPPGANSSQRPYASDFYTDEAEKPAYEAGGKYELAQPPQGAGIGRRRNPGGPASEGPPPSGVPAGPPLPQGNPGQVPGNAAMPSLGPPLNYSTGQNQAPGPNFGPGDPFSPGGTQNVGDQASRPRRPLPAALRGREPEEEARARPGPLPVALRGRPQPGTSAATAQPADDEWQITRWTREAGGSVKSFIFGSSDPPQRPPPAQNTSQQPLAGQPPNYAGPSQPQQGQPNGDPRPYNRTSPNGQGMAARGAYPPLNVPNPQASPPVEQASRPWYQIW